MGSIIGLRIDYNGIGAVRRQQHIPSKNEPKYPHPGGRGGDSYERFLGTSQVVSQVQNMEYCCRLFIMFAFFCQCCLPWI